MTPEEDIENAAKSLYERDAMEEYGRIAYRWQDISPSARGTYRKAVSE